MNKPEKITGVLVDVNAGTVKEATIEANLDSYYKALNCDCIDIVVRSLGPYRFDIICDDEGLLKDNARMSATDPHGHPMLADRTAAPTGRHSPVAKRRSPRGKSRRRCWPGSPLD